MGRGGEEEKIKHRLRPLQEANANNREFHSRLTTPKSNTIYPSQIPGKQFP